MGKQYFIDGHPFQPKRKPLEQGGSDMAPVGTFAERLANHDPFIVRADKDNGWFDHWEGKFYMDELPEIDFVQRYLDQYWTLFKDATLDDVPADLRQKYAAAKEHEKGLYLHGGVGTGKTHVLVAIYRDHAQPLGDVAIVVYQDMLDQLRDFEGVADEMFKFYRTVKVLLVDDIGVGSSTTWAQQQFERILDERVKLGLMTYFTSNYSLNELRDVLNASNKLGQQVNASTFDGDRIRSRIARLCDGYLLTGADRRLQ